MENKRTCLYDKHVALGALISPFGGFDMPIQYSSIIDEHNAVRKHCGVFDVSHMGEIVVSGNEAEKFVNYIFTNDVTGLAVGKVLYGMFCGRWRCGRRYLHLQGRRERIYPNCKRCQHRKRLRMDKETYGRFRYSTH